MTKSKKVGLGFLTFLPIVGLICYIIFFFMAFFNMAYEAQSLSDSDYNAPYEGNPMLGIGIILAVICMLVSVFGSIALMIYYIIHANKNPKFDSNEKLLWILVLVLAGIVGNIVYFFVHIAPSKPEEPLPIST